MKFKKVWFVFVLFAVSICKGLAKSDDCFRAGVYMHTPLYESDQEPNDINSITKRNLDVFEEIASKASKEGVKILVFPEDGIINTDYPRVKIANETAERIPDPSKGHYNPCEKPEEYKTRIKTYRLSCFAKNNGIYIVADYGDRIDCHKASDANCPDDGYYLFNTAVVFGADGSLVAKYHKMQLFYENYYNVPPKPEFVYFDTPFGRMGLFICFDIIFRNPGIELINKYGVQTMIFPTWWFDELPFRTAQQIQDEWAITNRVNLLASNMHIHKIGSVGGGIYSGQSGQMVTSDIFEKSPHLLIADIPIDSRNSGAKCLSNRFNKTILNTKFSDDSEYKTIVGMNLSNSQIQRLTNSEDSIDLCHNSLCCQLDYKLGSQNLFKEEMFWFMVSNRSGHQMVETHYPVSEEICGIFRCDDEKCHQFSIHTKQTVFKNLRITAKMSTNYAYPSANSNRLKLVPKTNLIYENNGKIGSEVKLSLIQFSEPILSFVLYGRSYDKDPPYRQ